MMIDVPSSACQIRAHANQVIGDRLHAKQPLLIDPVSSAKLECKETAMTLSPLVA
ncbi:uncharacterized protein PHALS_12195 [Plasmopara halstedii]|uniref:Uncharacterized protein n=1 Tax=Plasmopara halstedii TaxID=4781 RepID=A0A0P1ALC8_PLAHL|nr:uncharacterized protein PHALS_12195 [Plasmopara halstedii]CEG41880.1 hypothetical protein PHALS_12195 [Plasmopara halstedii]|eukprot:XP_024578249.1 hypothetical protein PHALS_12195 [Plasmopara halstedii]